MSGKCWDPVYHAAHYAANKAVYKARARAHDAIHLARCIRFVNAYKVWLGCRDCGNEDFRVLECHHRDPDLKVTNISDMIRRKLSLLRIVNELEKCDILCANCHRVETHVTLWR